MNRVLGLALTAVALCMGITACGDTTTSSVSTSSTPTQTPIPLLATPTPGTSAAVAQLISVAQKVYGKNQFSVCDAGGTFTNCPFTGNLVQKVIHRSATQLGPDPLGAGDGPGLQGTPVYTATVTPTGGIVTATVGSSATFVLTIVSVNGQLLVDGITINGTDVK